MRSVRALKPPFSRHVRAFRARRQLPPQGGRQEEKRCSPPPRSPRVKDAALAPFPSAFAKGFGGRTSPVKTEAESRMRLFAVYVPRIGQHVAGAVRESTRRRRPISRLQKSAVLAVGIGRASDPKYDTLFSAHTDSISGPGSAVDDVPPTSSGFSGALPFFGGSERR